MRTTVLHTTEVQVRLPYGVHAESRHDRVNDEYILVISATAEHALSAEGAIEELIGRLVEQTELNLER